MSRSLRRPYGSSYYTIHYMRKCKAVNSPCGWGLFSHKLYVYRQCFEMKEVKCLWFFKVLVLTRSIVSLEKSDSESTTINAICHVLDLSGIKRKYHDFDQTETKTEFFKFVRAQTN
jgi:hypothetical protein